MKTLISWNVNGIRAVLKVLDFVSEYDPDVLCLQETKARPEQVDMDLKAITHIGIVLRRKVSLVQLFLQKKSHYLRVKLGYRRT